MATPKKLPSGSWRVQVQINGKRHSLTFDKKPSAMDVSLRIAELETCCPDKGSFKQCALSYMEAKSNVLSPSTKRGYYSFINSVIPDDFLNKQINDITQIDVQMLINKYASDHAPKTVRNLHGFVSAILSEFRPRMVINTTLPQKIVKDDYIPTEKDIMRILEASKNDKRYHVCFQLGILGMRRSEICAASLDKIEGNILHIDSALVVDQDNNWVTKLTKTDAGTRDIYLPDQLIEEIKENGYIYDGHASAIIKALHRYQDKLGIERFTFHKLRHFYASYCHSKKMSDADIMASGGWKSDYVMKSIYRHEMNSAKEQKRIAKGLLPR